MGSPSAKTAVRAPARTRVGDMQHTRPSNRIGAKTQKLPPAHAPQALRQQQAAPRREQPRPAPSDASRGDPNASGSTQRRWPSLTQYTLLWLLIAGFLAYEYSILNGALHGTSVIKTLYAKNILLGEGQKLTPQAGGALSYRLGWIGFLVILMTNGYIARKRLAALKDVGRIPDWLNFHIFCGLLGPTIILFHCNFKVGGLVAVSFWSMMISFGSGIVGRYFYMQILSQRADYRRSLEFYEASFKRCQKVLKPRLPDAQMKKYKDYAILMAGGTPAVMDGRASLATVLLESMAGDLRLIFQKPPIPRGFPRLLRKHLKQYAVLRRKHATAMYYKRLMGYWHAFHLPFAVFMYAVVVIHIASALIFRVNH